MVKRYPKLESKDLAVNIPKTVVVCTDVFDEVVYLHQHKEAIGPESAERIGRGRMVERIQAVQTAAGRIDGQVTATDIAVEHQVAAVQGCTGQAAHNTVQGYLGIIRCTDCLGGQSQG